MVLSLTPRQRQTYMLLLLNIAFTFIAQPRTSEVRKKGAMAWAGQPRLAAEAAATSRIIPWIASIENGLSIV
jgi:hypothetical protein